MNLFKRICKAILILGTAFEAHAANPIVSYVPLDTTTVRTPGLNVQQAIIGGNLYPTTVATTGNCIGATSTGVIGYVQCGSSGTIIGAANIPVYNGTVLVSSPISGLRSDGTTIVTTLVGGATAQFSTGPNVPLLGTTNAFLAQQLFYNGTVADLSSPMYLGNSADASFASLQNTGTGSNSTLVESANNGILVNGSTFYSQSGGALAISSETMNGNLYMNGNQNIYTQGTYEFGKPNLSGIGTIGGSVSGPEAFIIATSSNSLHINPINGQVDVYSGSGLAGQTGQLNLYPTGNTPFSPGGNYVAIKSPNSLSGTTVWTFPSADGTNGQVLRTNGSGLLSWVTGSGGMPGGASTQIQFNNSGNFGGDSSYTWTTGNETLTVGAPARSSFVQNQRAIEILGAGGSSPTLYIAPSDAGSEQGLIRVANSSGSADFGVSGPAAPSAINDAGDGYWNVANGKSFFITGGGTTDLMDINLSTMNIKVPLNISSTGSGSILATGSGGNYFNYNGSSLTIVSSTSTYLSGGLDLTCTNSGGSTSPNIDVPCQYINYQAAVNGINTRQEALFALAVSTSASSSVLSNLIGIHGQANDFQSANVNLEGMEADVYGSGLAQDYTGLLAQGQWVSDLAGGTTSDIEGVTINMNITNKSGTPLSTGTVKALYISDYTNGRGAPNKSWSIYSAATAPSWLNGPLSIGTALPVADYTDVIATGSSSGYAIFVATSPYLDGSFSSANPVFSVSSGGYITSSGGLSISTNSASTAGAAALNLRSGSSSGYVLETFGRTGRDGYIGTVGSNGNFFTGSNSGDFIMANTNTLGKIDIGVGSGGASPALTVYASSISAISAAIPTFTSPATFTSSATYQTIIGAASAAIPTFTGPTTFSSTMTVQNNMLVQPVVNSTAAFCVNNALGVSIFCIDNTGTSSYFVNVSSQNGTQVFGINNVGAMVVSTNPGLQGQVLGSNTASTATNWTDKIGYSGRATTLAGGLVIGSGTVVTANYSATGLEGPINASNASLTTAITVTLPACTSTGTIIPFEDVGLTTGTIIVQASGTDLIYSTGSYRFNNYGGGGMFECSYPGNNPSRWTIFGLTSNPQILGPSNSATASAWTSSSQTITSQAFYVANPVWVCSYNYNIGVQNGNENIGTYQVDNMALVISTGPILVPSSGVAQTNITPVLLSPGWYLNALQFSNTTATASRIGATSNFGAYAETTTSPLALPNPLVPNAENVGIAIWLKPCATLLL